MKKIAPAIPSANNTPRSRRPLCRDISHQSLQKFPCLLAVFSADILLQRFIRCTSITVVVHQVFHEFMGNEFQHSGFVAAGSVEVRGYAYPEVGGKVRRHFAKGYQSVHISGRFLGGRVLRQCYSIPSARFDTSSALSRSSSTA